MELSKEDWAEYEGAEHCYICQKAFTEKDYKVRDHDHATGEYHGAAHCNCNLQKRKVK